MEKHDFMTDEEYSLYLSLKECMKDKSIQTRMDSLSLIMVDMMHEMFNKRQLTINRKINSDDFIKDIHIIFCDSVTVRYNSIFNKED